MSYLYGSDSCKRLEEENRRLQQEADDRRYEEDRHREQEYRERERARHERAQEAEERLRYPSDWQDAFCNARVLFSREAREEARDNHQIAEHLKAHPEDAGRAGYEPSTFFIEMPAKINRAEAIYNEEMEAVEAQIQTLRAAGLAKVATRVEAEIGDATITTAFQDNNPSHLTNW